jgi:uncharacterized protein
MGNEMRLGQEFSPSPSLKKLYHTYTALVIIFGFLTWLVPVAIFAPLFVTAAILIPLLLIMVLVLYWLPKYYKTITYKLTDHDMTWRRGVWFKNTGIVPYNRITNIDISQGPISRKFGIASLKIQTAGYSAPSSGRTSEITLDGIEDLEGLREFIMNLVKGRKPIAVESYEKSGEPGVLGELVKIRKLLEKGR